MENMPSTSYSSHDEIEDAALCEIVPSIATSLPSVDRPYDIFVNHRGMDVKNTLASHIYYALESCGLRVFLDKDSMETGELITAQIEDAIRNASVYIAIFSKNYAGSAWCLNELCLMMENPAKILAVFYDVEPCDLRWMDKDGPYARALKTHQEKGRYDPQRLEKWKRALFDAAGRTGCELRKGFNGDEGALVKHIVNNALKRVKREPLYIAKYPVGLGEVAEEFERTMLLRANENADKNVKVVGIVGMGGAGKTTLAKHLFNIKRSDYGRSSFLFDVRSNSSLTDLQSKLLKDLTGVDEKIYNTSEGIGILKSRRLSSCHALVILDDIDHVDQLEGLLVVKDVLRSGSLILVTSRDKGLLKRSQISFLYDMKKLRKRHAQELFCWHAFVRPFPVKGFEELVERFLVSCDGLPLSLKVFGALVYGNDITHWKSQLGKISRKLERDIKDRLRISYDALDEDDQEMFLDVACFFIGEDTGKAIRIWDGCGWNALVGLHTLENKCLIEIDDGDCIRMHDQLRDMGRDIVDEKSNKPRRLWRPDDVTDLHRRSGTTQLIRGIGTVAAPSHLSNDILELPRLSRLDRLIEMMGTCVEYLCGLSFETSSSLAGVSGLKLLVAEGDCFEGIFSGASTGLVWLCWHNCPYRSLPLGLHSMENLRVLELFDGDIQTLWHGAKGIPTQLRELNIRGCLIKFPKSIGQLKFLEKIVLDRFQFSNTGVILGSWNDTKTFPDEFCGLQSLKHLELRNFWALESLPQNFGNLINLQHLDLSGCMHLEMLPDSFDRLRQLQYLSLSNCYTLRFRQDTLGNMSALEHVDFSSCQNLQVLPIQITAEASLEKLHLIGTSLLELPNDIGELRNLKVLELGSPCVTSLPASIWNLSCLTRLRLWNCTNLKCLPQDDRDDMPTSRVKHLRGGFEHMKNLEYLDVLECPMCEVLPFTSVARKVEEEETMLDLRHSAGLLPKLKHLTLDDTEISRISITENVCPGLTSLSLRRNVHLVEIEALPKTLEYLILSECMVLKRITGLSHLANLFSLDISGCRELEELPNLEQLSSLERFEATGCWELEGLPNVSRLTSLKTLKVDDCWNLKRAKGLEKLTRLKELNISADNGYIWNDIQFLQRLPCSKLSSTSLTTRAVPGVESEVVTILNSLDTPVSMLEFVITEGLFPRYYGAFNLSDAKSVSAVMICIIFKASGRGDSLQINYPAGLNATLRAYEVFAQEGEWISLSIFTDDSEFFTDLKFHNAEQILIEWDRWNTFGEVEVKVKKGWIATSSNEEEEGKILEGWNRLMTKLHSSCSLYHNAPHNLN